VRVINWQGKFISTSASSFRLILLHNNYLNDYYLTHIRHLLIPLRIEILRIAVDLSISGLQTSPSFKISRLYTTQN